MPIRQNKQWELPQGSDEQKKVAEQVGIKLGSFATGNEFHSDEVTIKGERYVRSDSSSYTKRKDIRTKSEAIPGLRCPDCGSQAFKTDHKRVAVCGDYPGWYFFYRKLDQEKEAEQKTKYVMRNGEMVEVADTGQKVTKDNY